MNGEEPNNSELLRYISKVREELGKREAKLLGVEKSILNVESELLQYSGSKSVKKGDAALTLLSARYRTQLEQKLKALRDQSLEAQREVTRAKDRLRVAESELAQTKEQAKEQTGEQQ